MSAIATVATLYDLFNRGDLDAVRDLMDEDMVWESPLGYFVPEGRGRTEGRDRVIAMLARYPAYWESVAAVPDEVYDLGDGQVLVLGRQVGRTRRSGRAVENPFANLWRVDEDRLVEHRGYSDTWTVARALED